jgi:hypothetical protein
VTLDLSFLQPHKDGFQTDTMKKQYGLGYARRLEMAGDLFPQWSIPSFTLPKI